MEKFGKKEIQVFIGINHAPPPMMKTKDQLAFVETCMS
jgi:hypothetical protein